MTNEYYTKEGITFQDIGTDGDFANLLNICNVEITGTNLNEDIDALKAEIAKLKEWIDYGKY